MPKVVPPELKRFMDKKLNSASEQGSFASDLAVQTLGTYEGKVVAEGLME
jgi:hypothetical protein